MIDCVIPARNTAATVGDIIKTCARSPHIGRVIVGIDPPWEDLTVPIVRKLAEQCANVTWYRAHGEGKGQNCKTGLGYVESDRVLFLDSDIWGLADTHLAQLTQPHTGMIVGTRDHPYQNIPVMSQMSGERCLPASIARSVNLHGWAMEYQLNMAVSRAGLPLECAILRGLKTRYNWTVSDQRKAEVEADFQWLKDQHGKALVMNGSNNVH